MKVSQFSTFVPQQDMVVGYNTYTDHFIALNEVLHEMIKSGEAHNNIDELADYHPDFYSALVDGGFLVDEEVDEVKLIKDMVKRVDNDDRTYMLIINPTMNCNFKCWYCYETHVKGSKMVVSTLDRLYAMIDRQLETMPNLEEYVISFFGGEPLLNYRDVVVPVLEYAIPRIKAKGVTPFISFTTNGYLVNQEMVDYLKAFADASFQITLDGNRETHDTIRFINKKKGSYDKIMENVQMMLASKLNITLRINYTKKTLIGIADIIPDLLVLGAELRETLTVDFHQVWQDGDELGELTNDILAEFKKAGLYANSPYKFPNNVLRSCYGDKKNSVVVNYNGDIYKCTARDFTKKNRMGYLAEDGRLVYENNLDVIRLDSKFKNKPCLSCFMLPVCNGGCSQHAVEHGAAGEDYCVYDFDEDKKKQLVLDKFNFKYANA